MTLAERYAKLCATPSSINELLPILRSYAERCESVAEFGVDIGQSTTAFLMAQPKRLISVDTCRRPEIDEIGRMVGATKWMFLHTSSLACTLPEVDLLLIDSAHCYDQLIAELSLHHSSVRKWIVLHDTVAYGTYGEAGPPQLGITPAIEEFLARHPEWVKLEEFTHNNGLLILERIV